MKLSVVIAASNGPTLLRKCLQSLRNQDAEIVVVCNFAPSPTQELSDAKFFVLPAATTVPALRTHGLRNSSGEIVAFLEDNVTVAPDWAARLLEAHALPQTVVGGAVENRSRGALNWAVYFYEYGKYMPPNARGVTDTLAGNNLSYRREVLESIENEIGDGFYETFVNQKLINRGDSLYLAPDVVVYHGQSYRFERVVKSCFHHGRAFAAMRTEGDFAFKRAIFAASSPLLALILPARLARRVWAKGRHRAQLVRALPFLLLFMVVWAWGEGCGYLRGAGRSIEEWR